MAASVKLSLCSPTAHTDVHIYSIYLYIHISMYAAVSVSVFMPKVTNVCVYVCCGLVVISRLNYRRPQVYQIYGTHCAYIMNVLPRGDTRRGKAIQSDATRLDSTRLNWTGACSNKCNSKITMTKPNNIVQLNCIPKACELWKCRRIAMALQMPFITFKINKQKADSQSGEDAQATAKTSSKKTKLHFNESITMIGFCWQLSSEH